MSAAALELETFPEATQVDVPVGLRQVRGRLSRGETRPGPELDDGVSNPEKVDDPQSRALSPPRPGRVSELYLRAVEGRKGSASRQSASAFEPGAPKLLFARVDDPGLSLRKRPHGFELSGRATMPGGRYERRLAIAFDGELFAVVVQPGESAAEVVDRLRPRLRGRYELEAQTTTDGGVSVRFHECSVTAF